MPHFQPPVMTDRLALRYFEASDLNQVAGYYSLPEMQRYLDWKARDRIELQSALAGMVEQRRLNRPGDVLALAVVRRCDEALMGQVSLRWTDATAGQAELRFALNPLFRRQGYATEAIRAALNLGFEAFRFHRVFVRCGADNRRSARLLKQIGIRLEAHYREHALFNGEWDEELHFAILDREWMRPGKVQELPQRAGGLAAA